MLAPYRTRVDVRGHVRTHGANTVQSADLLETGTRGNDSERHYVETTQQHERNACFHALVWQFYFFLFTSAPADCRRVNTSVCGQSGKPNQGNTRKNVVSTNRPKRIEEQNSARLHVKLDEHQQGGSNKGFDKVRAKAARSGTKRGNCLGEAPAERERTSARNRPVTPGKANNLDYSCRTSACPQ